MQHDSFQDSDDFQPNFDVYRYQGLWYDVARFTKFFDYNNPWQTAEYRVMKDDENSETENIYVEVHNVAYNEDGSVKKEIFGRADIVDDRYPAGLYVSFSRSIGGLFSMLFSDSNVPNYIVHETDYENYAIVGSFNRNSLYILARKRPISVEMYKMLLMKVYEMGYDIKRLEIDYGALK